MLNNEKCAKFKTLSYVSLNLVIRIFQKLSGIASSLLVRNLNGRKSSDFSSSLPLKWILNFWLKEQGFRTLKFQTHWNSEFKYAGTEKWLLCTFRTSGSRKRLRFFGTFWKTFYKFRPNLATFCCSPFLNWFSNEINILDSWEITIPMVCVEFGHDSWPMRDREL